jgi:hypothetical protein
MGRICKPGKVNLIVGLLSGDAGALAKAAQALRRNFGRTDFESPVTDFTYTDYYEKEMGAGLKRQFLSFKKTFDLNGICKIKVQTNNIERRFSKNGARKVNIDPGYLDLAKVVLFSTKDFSHRIYLGRGIFAEVTLMYKDRTYNELPWTYPDYRTGEYINIFNRIREIYKAKLS